MASRAVVDERKCQDPERDHRAGHRWPHRDAQAACPREADELDGGGTEQEESDRLEDERRREPYGGDREGDEDGAAQDAGHFAPSATGDGLMPPYRRSRFW